MAGNAWKALRCGLRREAALHKQQPGPRAWKKPEFPDYPRPCQFAPLPQDPRSPPSPTPRPSLALALRMRFDRLQPPTPLRPWPSHSSALLCPRVLRLTAPLTTWAGFKLLNLGSSKTGTLAPGPGGGAGGPVRVARAATLGPG